MPDGLSGLHILILAGAFLFFYVSSRDMTSKMVAMLTVLVAALGWQAANVSDDEQLQQAQALFDACPAHHRARVAIADAPTDTPSAEVLNELIAQTGTHVAMVLEAGSGTSEHMFEPPAGFHVASIAGWDEDALLLISKTMTEERRFDGPAELRLENGRRIQVRFDERSPGSGLALGKDGEARWNDEEVSLEGSHGLQDAAVANDVSSIRPDGREDDGIQFGLAEFCFLRPTAISHPEG